MWDIRPEQPGDAGAIRRLHELAFEGPAEAGLVEALRASGDHVGELCLVALRDGELVGHVELSRASLDSGHDVLALGPVGVLPELQRGGAGSALIREALHRAAATDFPIVVLLGHPTYYPRFGFEPATELGVDAPWDVPAEAWLALRLPAYRDDVRGTLVYPAPWGAVT
jgi:putative acetyltransferase